MGPEGDINADISSGDASVTVKSPEIDVKTGKLSGKTKSKGLSCFGKPTGKDLDGEYKASADVKLDAPEGDTNTELPSADASIAVKSPELDVKPVKVSGKPKSAGMSCFGKPKGKDLDGEYKASTGVKVDVPEGDINADLPSGDASVTVKSPNLDVKTGKPSGKSKGLSCFGKPKGRDLDGKYKASADVKLNAPEGDINAELPSADASIAVKSPELDVKPVK